MSAAHHNNDPDLSPHGSQDCSSIDISRSAAITASSLNLSGSDTQMCAGAVADDFYHRYLNDIAAMRLLGVKRFRMSIAWPRIFPGGDGQVNQQGLDFYARVLEALLVAGIEPHVTLYHWDLPQVTQRLLLIHRG